MLKQFKMNIKPIKTKKDLQLLLTDILEPLKGYFSEGCAQLKLGSSTGHYGKRIEWLEGFARPLFGLVPLSAGGGESEYWDIYLEGIRNGTNPEHPEYWGRTDNGQMFVEMAPFGMALAMVPEKIWNPLSEKEKKNLEDWLLQINPGNVGTNNWLFFRVFVNIGLKKVGASYDEALLEETLKQLDSHYIADGWYSDGITAQRDYYIPFAMHFYGLIYSVLMEKDDPKRATAYKERAGIFAKDFIHWFANDGSALPFGRSLTYRFAMGAFWGGLAFAGVEAFSWGIIKKLTLEHLRWWMQQEIFNNDGILSIGYTYSNLKMAEFYNAPGSVNWALKAFIPLALQDDHPFWTADEEDLPNLKEISVQEHPYMLVCREQDRDHVFVLTGGQHAKWEPTFDATKYSKFAYSTVFGFSVPAAEYGLEQGAFDSMLALCENDNLYRVRKVCEEIKITDKYHYSRWKPWQDVEVSTWLIPAMPWHIRVHKINSNRELTASEGGFAINIVDTKGDVVYDNDVTPNSIFTKTHMGISGVVNAFGERVPEAIMAAPNTNLLYPRTLIPSLKGEVHKGETWLISCVLGQPNAQDGSFDLENYPEVVLKDGVLTIIQNEKTILLEL